nr:hypothetical protein [Tanacetum cinerariifolium]
MREKGYASWDLGQTHIGRSGQCVVIRDLEETATPSTIVHSEPPKSKDKGKGILVEEPKPLKKQVQIEQDKTYARELEVKLNNNINYDDVIEKVKRKEKQDNAVLRYQALKRKPQTKAHARKNMMVYLKNMAGFKMDFFKERRYPLTRFTLDQMLNDVRLEVKEESKVSLELLRFVRRQQQEGYKPNFEVDIVEDFKEYTLRDYYCWLKTYCCWNRYALSFNANFFDFIQLDEDKKGKAVDPLYYRGMIGTLLYLTASKPDLQFAICMCARYQARPTKKHDSPIALTAFADADPAGCQDTRRSTSGSVQFLGERLISCFRIMALHLIKFQCTGTIKVLLLYAAIMFNTLGLSTSISDIISSKSRDIIEFLTNKLGMRSLTLETLKKLMNKEDD